MLTLDPHTCTVCLQGGASVRLSPAEFALLWHLSEMGGAVVPRGELARQLTKGHGRALGVLVHRLRRRMGDEGAGVVATVRKVGYRLNGEVAVTDRPAASGPERIAHHNGGSHR